MLYNDKDIEGGIRTLIFWAFFLVFALVFSHSTDGRPAGDNNSLLPDHYTTVSANHSDIIVINIPDISSLQKFYINTLNSNDLPKIYRNLRIVADNNKMTLAIESLETARLNISAIPLTDLLCCLRFFNSGDIPVLS